jgi:poly-gamma-glutamate capsule biosynthesis protein CapA/YwtB (metallophosphatase superfamily)
LTAALFLGGLGSLFAQTREKTVLTVTAVGDVRITPELARNHSEEIRRIKLRGDLVFANFEGVLDDSGSNDPWKFSVPINSIVLLHEVGFNTLNLANNHSLDLGEESYRKTSSLLQQHGFWVVGREGHGAVAAKRTRHVRVIGFSFSSENNVNDLDAIPAVIGRKQGEIVVVSAHMGGENSLGHLVPNDMEYFGDERRGNVVEFSHRCVDSGADLVLGHGPHVPRGIELYKNKLIVYSLGNFIFDYPGAERSGHAPGYSITINLNDSGDFQSAHIDSYDLQHGIPVLDSSGRAYDMIWNLTLQNLKQTSLQFPGKGLVARSK